jgi:hypothetical protein
LDVRNEHGEPLLFYVIQTKSLSSVKTLVELGAFPIATDPWGYTPAIDACFSQATDKVAFFLDTKFNHDQLHDGQPLLHQSSAGCEPGNAEYASSS